MGVLAIWRYPVKAMLGELLDAVAVGASGLAGDRRWVVADAVTGQRIASKRGRTDPRLRACRARLDGDGRLAVTLPGGETTHDVAGALSDLLGRRVTLVEEGRPHHDFAPLHVVTTGVLERMRAVAPGGDWDPRRFRPNLLLDGGEDRDLLGCELRARSGLRLHVELPTPRCVVPTRASEELPRDTSLLRTLARTDRWDLGPAGRQPCLGTYARVRRGGRLTTGERLGVRRGDTSPEAVVAATLAAQTS